MAISKDFLLESITNIVKSAVIYTKEAYFDKDCGLIPLGKSIKLKSNDNVCCTDLSYENNAVTCYNFDYNAKDGDYGGYMCTIQDLSIKELESIYRALLDNILKGTPLIYKHNYVDV